MTRVQIEALMLLAMSEHHSGNIGEASQIVDAQLAALEAVGVRLVPEAPSYTMMVHGEAERQRGEDPDYDGGLSADIYRAMLAASPYAKE